MAQEGEPNPLDTAGLCLLSLDGGGVRGLSTLFILKGLMTRLNGQRQKYGMPSVKPCELFDLIGGTGTGGLIAIMLGKLEMNVEDCIQAYTTLMKAIFTNGSSWLPFSWSGNLQARFDSAKLKDAIKDLISSQGYNSDDSLSGSKEEPCRTFVCATAKETKSIARLRSYVLSDEATIPATICEAALATCAATGLFESVSIGARQFFDGALGANNPANEVESEAANIWSPETGDPKSIVKCFVSIGAGNPGKSALETGVLGFVSRSLVGIATETEETERKLIARWAKHFDEKRFFHLNVDQGMQTIGTADHTEQGRIEAATDEYLRHQAQKFRVRDCISNLQQKQKKTDITFSSALSKYNTHRIVQSHMIAKTVHYIPFPKNRYFVGRQNELDELKQRLIIDQDCQKMSIVGLGGTGKTQIALQFAFMIKETQPQRSVFWLPAVNMESFEQACTEVAKALRIPVSKDDDVKELMQRCLSAPGSDQQWLIVLDNADDHSIVLGTAHSKGVVDYLPESDRGMTLYTARTQEVAEALTRADILDLGSMGQQDAEEMLKKSLVKKSLLDDRTAVAQLLDELAYLPLAIRQATAYLNMNKTPSIAKYLHLLQKTEQDLIGLVSKEFRDNTRYKGSGNAVATTWMVSFDQIRENNALATDLLAFVSTIEWRAIPYSLIPNGKSQEETEEAIGLLCGYCFFTRRDQAEECYDMHRLVHLAFRIWRDQHGETTQTIESAVQHVTNIFPSDDYENRTVWRAYMPHASRLLESLHEIEIDQRSELALSIGTCLIADGRFGEAVDLLELSCRWRAGLDEENTRLLTSQRQLAIAYGEDWQLEKALNLLEHVVDVQKRIFAEDDIERLASQYEVATVYRSMNQVKKAIMMFENIIAIQKKSLPNDNPHLLKSQHALAVAYQDERQFRKAIELFEHIICLREKLYVPDHPSVLVSQQCLAATYIKDKQVKKALDLLENIDAIMCEKWQDEDHPDQLEVQHNLGSAYHIDGQIEKAIYILEAVVTKRGRIFREDHPSLLQSQAMLALSYKKDGQLKKTIELFEHVKDINDRNRDQDDPEQLRVQYELAYSYTGDGQIKKAIKLPEHVVKRTVKVLEEGDSIRLASHCLLALAYDKEGQIEKAVPLLEHVVKIQAMILEEDDPDRLLSVQTLERMYDNMKLDST